MESSPNLEVPRGIQRRGSSFLVDVSVNGQRSRVTCATLSEAIAKQDALKVAIVEHQVKQAARASAGTWTLGEAFEQVSTLVWQGTLSEEAAIRNAKKALAFFGAQTPLDEITTDYIDQFIVHLMKAEHAAGSVNRKLAALSRMLTYAHENGHLAKLPTIRRRKEVGTVIRYLTRAEETQMLALFDQWGKDEHSEAFCILIDTGLRPSELYRILPKDCLWENNVLYIPKTKNNEARSVPMTKRVQEILRRRIEVSPGPIMPLFPYDNGWFIRMWDRAKGVMGLTNDEHFTPYALRKTCACRLVQRGVNLAVVQKWLGHKTIQVTMRYAVASPENLMDAVKVLEDC